MKGRDGEFLVMGDCAWDRKTEVGALSPRSETARELLTAHPFPWKLRKLITDKIHEGLELKQPGITTLNGIVCRHLTQSSGKTKAQKQYQPQGLHRHSKLYRLTQPSPSGKKIIIKQLTSSTTTQAQVTPNKKWTQKPRKQPFPLRAKNQKEEGIHP